jgi:hypothetical protein
MVGVSAYYLCSADPEDAESDDSDSIHHNSDVLALNVSILPRDGPRRALAD